MDIKVPSHKPLEFMPINISYALELIGKSHEKNEVSTPPAALYDPRNYVMRQGGKRMRSLLCLIGYGLYKDDLEQALDLAYAVELFHNFTLVHDDIMDEAPTRRGQPAVHAAYDTSSAILTGDVMLIEVYKRLAQLNYHAPLEMIQIMNTAAKEVCEGQSYDMTFEKKDDVSLPDYLEMIELKTAVLLGAAIEMGAKLAGASEVDQVHLRKYAINSGVSFQLQDDFLDVYGDPEKFGKKVGGDIIQGKKTYLYLRALALMEESDRVGLKDLYTSTSIEEEDKVARVRAIFDELFIPNYCDEAKKAFHDLSLSHLEMTSLSEETKKELADFSLKLMNRSN